MRELAELQEIAGRAGSYAILNFSGNTADPARGALLQRMQEKATAIETALLFFELEWAALDDARAEELLAADGLDFARHHLRSARRYRPHLLSEPEERIFTERALTGRTAWTRLFEEQASAITVELPDATEPVSLEVALARLFAPDRELRRDTAERVTQALAPGLRTRAFAFNTLLADKMVEDRLRHFPNWLASRNLANEASDESVQALVEAVRARYEVPRRWYRLKAQLLGRRQARRLRPPGAGLRRRRARRLERGARPRARLLRLLLGRARRRSRSASSTRAGSTRRCARTSAAARSAPTRCPPRTRTCCSTTPTSAAT